MSQMGVELVSNLRQVAKNGPIKWCRARSARIVPWLFGLVIYIIQELKLL